MGAKQHTWHDPGSLHFPKGSRSYYHPLRTDGCFALGIHSSVFDELLAEITKNDGPFDSYPTRRIVKKHQSHTFVLQPNLIVADVRSSDTQGGRDQEIFAQKMRWDMRMYDT
eukprot:417122_1